MSSASCGKILARARLDTGTLRCSKERRSQNGIKKMDTLDFILNKFKINFHDKPRIPIEIPNIGRDNLADLFKELGFKIGAEIGVYYGWYSEKLCRANPEMKFYAIDPWRQAEGFEAYDDNRLEDAYRTARKTLNEYNCTIIRKTSKEAANDFEDNSLDFVYIDANHAFEHVYEDITAWSKKVRIGGIISGHDFIKFKDIKQHKVVEAVLSYVLAHNIRPWFLLGSRKNIPGMIRDRHRSWMWVRSV